MKRKMNSRKRKILEVQITKVLAFIIIALLIASTFTFKVMADEKRPDVKPAQEITLTLS